MFWRKPKHRCALCDLESHGHGPNYDSELSSRNVTAVDVNVTNLAVQFKYTPPPWTRAISLVSKKDNADTRPSTITALHGVSAEFPAGSLTAIIGASGSGKTTLLNAIANRVKGQSFQAFGTVTFDGGADGAGVRSSYVMQQDVLLPTLTVRETLQYAADLRLPSPSTKEERRRVIENVILELGLKECADTRIGNSIHKGCSGGEKRRTSIGVQMLANPSILYCDEPTTGLDAFNALQVMQTLKKLSSNGRTVIVSIHTPRSEIWTLFDRVILLSRGYTLYSGPTSMVVDHFKGAGFDMPSFVNPAEFLIDLAAIDNRSTEREEESWIRVNQLREAWDQEGKSGLSSATSHDGLDTAADTTAALSKESQQNMHVGFSRQLAILTRRSTKVTLRDPMGIAASLFEATAMSVLTGWIFVQLNLNLAGIKSREGSLYNASSLQGYLVLLYECYRLTFDIQLFDRERSEGVVSVMAFLLSRRLSRLLLEDLVVPTIFALIYYFMVGYRLSVSEFFIFYVVMIIMQYIAVNLAALCVAVSRNFAGASLIANLSYTIQSLACGYFVQIQQIPVYVRWLKWVTYNYYIFGALISNEFVGLDTGKYGRVYNCPYSNNPEDPACYQYLGKNIVKTLGLPSNWIWRPMVVAVSFAILFFLLAAAVLTFWKTDIGLANGKITTDEKFMIARDPSTEDGKDVQPVSINLIDYGLAVDTHYAGNWWKSKKKTILNPVNCKFDPGKINVIMGPSGSGKTSLMQSMANRITSSFSSRYQFYGHMTFNGAVPTEDVIKSVVSFVTQDDDALLPALTVRETLRFAAILRLPVGMSRDAKISRAEEVILKMGLKDCADNMIGSNLKKGVSGGERRRVSIAIQILTDPKVLLLDEPTSGLDAFTATSIMDVLKALVDEGRTLIMTIHQARSDLYEDFDNVLLLARGGWPVYAGPRHTMLSHFRKEGYQCPTTTNPADFVLDLITVNLQHHEQEYTSRRKVQGLIDVWGSKNREQEQGLSPLATRAELTSLKRDVNSFRVTFPTILHRSSINVRRQPHILLARIMQVVGIGVIFTLFFAPLQLDYEAIQSRVGFVQECGALYFVGMLQNLSVYPVERLLFYREDLDNCYTVSTFLLAYTVLELPFEIFSSIIFGALAAFAVNLERTVELFFIASFNCFCIINCGESVGIIFCTFFSSQEGFAVAIMSILLSIANIMGGIMSLEIPACLQALNHMSPVKYMVANLANYSLSGKKFTCAPDQKGNNGECPISTGYDVLELYNLDYDPGLNLLYLGLCILFYRFLAFVVLWLARMRWNWRWFGKKDKSIGRRSSSEQNSRDLEKQPS